MKMFKRIIAAVLLAAMMLTLMTGCSSAQRVKDNVYDQIGKVYSNLEKDSDLEKKAEAFVQTFAKGENLESNTDAGIAYAKVSREETAFWELIEEDNDVVMPIWYDPYDDGTVNVGLMMMCNDSAQAAASLYKSKTLDILGKGDYARIGVATVEIKGDIYCVIIAGK